uniref:Murine retrovirus integration site 1 homolog n=1 Tax=Cyprinus carpio TaxID=7962 RepID=A0A8C1ZRI6_CYPCA
MFVFNLCVRSHSPRPRLSRNSASSCPITTVDNDGHMIDLVKDQLPELQLSEEDRQKNLELIEEAKKVSDRFLQRRGRRSTCSLSESPTGPSSSLISSPSEEEAKEKPDALPNISDIMLRKLKLHRGLPGCAPPLSEKEVENAFVQLSLAFRNDNYTLESRLKQAERERNLTEENAEKELEEFKSSLKNTVSLWQNIEQREFYQHLLETIAVLHRLTNRLSSRAEMVGAVRQEKRMNKATEVMMQYVENLKRTYEKDHAELMEFKKVASQNSSRCYCGCTASRRWPTSCVGESYLMRSCCSLSPARCN